TDGLGEPAAARLVAHVRAVGQVVGAELADEELVEEGGLVAGPAAGVEDRLVGTLQRVDFARNQRKRLVPRQRLVMGGPRPEHHRLGEPALLSQPEVALPRQLGHAVAGKKVARDAILRALLGNGFGAVLAELEAAAAIVRLGPGAAGAVVSLELVEPGEQARAADEAGLPERVLRRGEDGGNSAGHLRRLPRAQRDGIFRRLGAGI